MTDNDIASFLSVLFSLLPFVYGFVNTHWTHMTNFMLEKSTQQSNAMLQAHSALAKGLHIVSPNLS